MSSFARAFHESGQCVVAHVKGIPTVRVSIANDDPRWHYGPFTPQQARDAIVAALAGFEGERRFDPDTPIGVAKGDRTFAHEVFAHDIKEGNEADFMLCCAQEARDLLCQNWRAVEAVASLLIEHRTLTG